MNWSAKWIWAKGYADTPNCYIYARKEIDLPQLPDATLYITCSSEYRLYVNGRYAGRGNPQSGPAFQVYDSYDVKRSLRPGRNVFGVICYNSGSDTACAAHRSGGLLVQVNASHSDEPVLVSDETWRVRPAEDWDFGSHRISVGIGFQEVYDSRKKPVGWNVVGFDDVSWEEPDVLGEAGEDPWGVLIQRSIPNLAEYEITPNGRISGVVIEPGANSSVMLDFGREVVGYPIIKIRDGGAAELCISYAEELSVSTFMDKNADYCSGGNEATRITAVSGKGFPETTLHETTGQLGSPPRIGEGLGERLGFPLSTLHSQLPSGEYTDKLILHGGRQEWQSFGRRTFRYICLTLRNVEKPIHIDSVRALAVGYPTQKVWNFNCSDDLLNEIYSAGVNKLSRCMQDSYERDPMHDPCSYPSDSRIQALNNYYSFGDFRLAASDLRMFARKWAASELYDFPKRARRIMKSPQQALCWIIMLHDYDLYGGDSFVVEELYSRMHSMLESRLRSMESSDGLLANSAGVEASAWNALYYEALRDASKLARRMGHYDDAMNWHARAEAVRHTVNSHHKSNTKQISNASTRLDILAVALGLTDECHNAEIKQSILKSATKLRWKSGFYALQAMAKLDIANEALDFIRAGSRDGAPIHFLLSEIVGIKPSMPHSPVKIIQPKTCDLEWARGGYTLPEANLDVEWNWRDGKFILEIESTDDFIVALPVSAFKAPVVHEIDLTPETPERKARKTYGWGDIIWQGGHEHDLYLDWLASQEADPPGHYQPKLRCDLQGQYIWVRESVSRHVRYVVHDET